MLSTTIRESVPRAIRALRRMTSRSLTGTVTFQDVRLLFFIKEGLSGGQMAEALQVSPAAISKGVHSLEAKKMIVKEIGEDKRCQLLKLTPEGLKVHRAVAAHQEKILEKVLKKLSTTEKTQLEKGLLILDKVMNSIEEEIS